MACLVESHNCFYYIIFNKKEDHEPSAVGIE